MAFGATTLGFLGMFHAAEFVSPGLATIIANAQRHGHTVVASIDTFFEASEPLVLNIDLQPDSLALDPVDPGPQEGRKIPLRRSAHFRMGLENSMAWRAWSALSKVVQG